MKKFIFDIETTSLSFVSGRITCIVLHDMENNTTYKLFNEDEKLMLNEFWNLLNQGDVLIGFNIFYFDAPFVQERSKIHGLEIKEFISIDVRLKLTNGDRYMKGKLHDWARNILKIEPKTDNGFKMIDYWNNKEYDKILEHCSEDVEITRQLFEHLEREQVSLNAKENTS